MSQGESSSTVDAGASGEEAVVASHLQPASAADAQHNADSTKVAADSATVASGDGGAEASPAAAFYAQFPVSLDGSCPYCRSWDVQYLVLCPGTEPQSHEASSSDPEDTAAAAATAAKAPGKGESEVSSEAPPKGAEGEGAVEAGASVEVAGFPPVVQRLLNLKRAAKVWRSSACPEPSSFRCLTCTYGFNLDWSRTNLETIFYWYLNPSAAQQGAGYWGSDVNQYRLQQQAWDQAKNGGKGVPDVDARAAALDMILNKIEHKAGAGAAAAATAAETGALGNPNESAAAAAPTTWVKEFKEYSTTANFTEMGGRFSATSNEEYWEKKGIPKQREMRLIAHFMDPSQLVEEIDPDAPKTGVKRKKLTKREIQEFKEKKKAKKLEAQRAFLKD